MADPVHDDRHRPRRPVKTAPIWDAVHGLCLRAMLVAGRRRAGVLDDDRVLPAATRWNHNIHCHWLLLVALPRQAVRLLDVGCREGMLTGSYAGSSPT